MKNINNIRQSQGLRPLKMDASLTEAAMLRAAELAYQREENGLYNANTSRPNSGSEGMLLEEQCPSLNFAGDLGFACAIHPYTDLTPTSFEVTGHFNYDKAMEVVELVNRERSRRGLKPYFFDSTLTELAMIRSAEMKGTEAMSHFRPNGGYVDTIKPYFEVLVINYAPSKGENVGFGQETAEEVVNAWMNSPGHCAAIISKDFTCMGAGEFDGYWTQLFMTPISGSKLVCVKKSSPHVEEVTVRVALTCDVEENRVLKRKRQ